MRTISLGEKIMDSETIDLQRAAAKLVANEVYVCLSSLISAIAGDGSETTNMNTRELYNQAAELCAPLYDYEEAARQEGWEIKDGSFYHKDAEEESGITADPDDACGWEDLCREAGIEPYDREVFEHWAISQWLGKRLEVRGEKVDFDFAGLVVWARTTTGQGIASDYCIEQIVRETSYAMGR